MSNHRLDMIFRVDRLGMDRYRLLFWNNEDTPGSPEANYITYMSRAEIRGMIERLIDAMARKDHETQLLEPSGRYQLQLVEDSRGEQQLYRFDTVTGKTWRCNTSQWVLL